VISLLCWRALFSPEIVPSNVVLKAFDDHTFKPRGIILVFPDELRGEKICLEVELVDAPLDYNLLLR